MAPAGQRFDREEPGGISAAHDHRVQSAAQGGCVYIAGRPPGRSGLPACLGTSQPDPKPDQRGAKGFTYSTMYS
jgi:hypothetical protein